MRDRRYRATATALAFLVMAVSLLAACSTSKPAQPSGAAKSLAGEWQLVGSSLSSVDVAGMGITARFASERVTGFGGLDHYSGAFASGTDGSFSVSSLQADLSQQTDPEAYRAQVAYLELLKSARRYRIVDQQLTLRDAGGEEILIFAPVVYGGSGSGQATGPASPGGDRIAYAKSLGGKSHEGETLYLIVGGVEKTEKAALKRLADAMQTFGDMQSYFIVQRSDNFRGMDPGSWVVVEAYRDKNNVDPADPTGEANLRLARRMSDKAYVVSVVVKTQEPIPVYEDEVMGPDSETP